MGYICNAQLCIVIFWILCLSSALNFDRAAAYARSTGMVCEVWIDQAAFTASRKVRFTLNQPYESKPDTDGSQAMIHDWFVASRTENRYDNLMKYLRSVFLLGSLDNVVRIARYFDGIGGSTTSSMSLQNMASCPHSTCTHPLCL
jgi:hypothetical protein